MVVAGSPPRGCRHTRPGARPCPLPPSRPSAGASCAWLTLATLPAIPTHLRHGNQHRAADHPARRRAQGHRRAPRYAADNHPQGMLYAVMAVSSVARGRVTHHRRRGRDARIPSVVEVMTSGAWRRSSPWIRTRSSNPFMFRLDLLQNSKVRYANQADRRGDRRDAGGRHRRRHPARAAQYRDGAGAGRASTPMASFARRRASGVGEPPRRESRATSRPGCPRAALRVDATYETAAQYHNADGAARGCGRVGRRARLTVDTPSQGHGDGADRAHRRACSGSIPAENMLVRSARSSAAAFGSKGLPCQARKLLGMMAARLTRQAR